MKRYYSLREISQELDIPKSTIVKYKDYFGDYMKMAGDGKRKKFEEEAVQVLRDIRRMRENEKLDWLEIKDILEERYGGAEKEEEKEPAPPPQPAQTPQLDHIAHMINAVGGEILGIARSVNALQQNSRRQDRAIINIDKKLRQNQKNVDLVMSELLEREKTARKDYNDTVKLMKQGFAKILVNMQHIRETVAEKSSGGDCEALEQKVDKLAENVEQVISEGTLFQGKYQVLLRENELLRRKLNELAETKKGEEAQEKPSGFMGLFKK